LATPATASIDARQLSRPDRIKPALCGVFFVSLTAPGAFQRVLVQIGWQERKMAVPLSQLEAINPDESTKEGIGDWHHSVSLGYCL
jgi:hypothetical protein